MSVRNCHHYVIMSVKDWANLDNVEHKKVQISNTSYDN